MIVGVNRNRIDGCRTNERIIRDHAPSGSVATAVGRFPHSATDRSEISHDAAVHSCSWIDSNRVQPALRGGVVKAIEAAGHALRLRTERGKTTSAKGIRISKIKLKTLSKGDASWHARMFPGGCAHPGWVKPAGRKRQTIVPILFQPCQTSRLLPFIAPRHGHVPTELSGTPPPNP